jgi:DNA-binding LacI/PurR family transcriptional regulator
MALTSADVARHAGVSRSTVSYVLNGHGDRFAPATRKAVEDAVAALGYRPQAAGRALSRGLSDLVVLVMPIAANSRLGELVDQLSDAFAEEGLALVMRSANASLASFQTIITTAQPCAVIALSSLTDAEHATLKAAEVQTLDIAAEMSAPGGLNWTLGRTQVEHLTSRGFRRIAYARLTEARDDVLLQAREDGVRDACREFGFDEPLIINVKLRADQDLDAVTSLPKGTGVACYNDDTAAAVLGAANVLGRKVPDDLGFIGMDDTPVATQTTPRLTTITFHSAGAIRDLVNWVIHGTTDNQLLPDDATSIRVVQGGTT